MKQKIYAIILAMSLMLGVSAAYAQPITFEENQPPLTPGQQAPQKSPLLQNTPEGINSANNLANFDLSVKDKQSLAEFFNKCPSGIILYKVDGQFYVFCFQTPTSGKLFGLDTGLLATNINIKVESTHGDNNKRGDDRDKGNDGGPDGDCLFNASLPKCDPDENGECPDDFNLNEDGNCFPDHHETGCPDGYHGVDDDETGQCYKNKDGCPDGMTLRENGKSCGYTDELCPDENNPNCSTDEEPFVPPLIPAETCEPGSENGECVALDSNCGGEPCTASEKEDSTTSDPVVEEADQSSVSEEVPDEQPEESDTSEEQPEESEDVSDTSDSDDEGESSGNDEGDEDDN